ncbi:hypothetical protein AAFF_G00375690 [Aldrovandia affinis]|uniref:Uncharacterized protein n=1 Tax=Aldrovandia affinis TaxID=143900 RepID=A0AAD7R4F1_9TELE|nr:hypothetical protein AAFF_G00375690 [Aldrovandia affinis]
MGSVVLDPENERQPLHIFSDWRHFHHTHTDCTSAVACISHQGARSLRKWAAGLLSRQPTPAGEQRSHLEADNLTWTQFGMVCRSIASEEMPYCF